MVKELSIGNYKGFRSQQTLEFAIPDQNKNGSGLTLIVGPNNAGKTTIIESLLIDKNKKFNESERHEAKTNIKISNMDGKIADFTHDGSIVENVGVDHNIKFQNIPSKRFWESGFSGSSSLDRFTETSTTYNLRSMPTLGLAQALSEVFNDKNGLKKEFDYTIKEIISTFTDWEIETDHSNQDYIKYKTRDLEHRSNLLGEGVLSIFVIVAHLVKDSSNTLIIDEPELSLHPFAQKRLAIVLSKFAKKRQIIVCTHSPHFVNWSDFENGAKIIRLNKHGDIECTVHVINNQKNYADLIVNWSNNYQKPEFLYTTAKEILFSNHMLFTEGKEDVGLIKKWAKDKGKILNFDIFGYGVDGEANMKLFLTMASDLGLEKVGALYDGNSTNFKKIKIVFKNFYYFSIPRKT